MIDNIIQSVTEKLSSLPYIEGIVFGVPVHTTVRTVPI